MAAEQQTIPGEIPIDMDRQCAWSNPPGRDSVAFKRCPWIADEGQKYCPLHRLMFETYGVWA